MAVAGNVGTALSLAGRASWPPDATVVCEASSFQLEDTEAFAPEAAVLLNLAPDHLDRHGSYEDYVAAKLRVFANQGNDDVAVAPDELGIEDLGGCARRVLLRLRPRGRAGRPRRPPVVGRASRCCAADELSLPGAHNRAERDGGRRRAAWRAASSPRRWPPGCGASPASPTGSS